ncbi:MAG: flagellar biosynthetic protein FliO [Bryobacteraceae bacterium]
MEILHQIAAIVFVLALLVALLWRLQGRAMWGPKPARGRLLEAVEQLRLGPQHTVHLVRCGERALLVVAHPAGCALIESRPAGELLPPSAAISQEAGR